MPPQSWIADMDDVLGRSVMVAVTDRGWGPVLGARACRTGPRAHGFSPPGVILAAGAGTSACRATKKRLPFAVKAPANAFATA
jgi:hypothetical protein